jgi:GTP-binding protein
LLEDATRPTESPESQVAEAVDRMIVRYQAIRNELGLFNEALLHKPEIVVLNKLDLIESDPELIELARSSLRKRIASIRGTHPITEEPLVVSAVSGSGIENLIFTIQKELDSQKRPSQTDDIKLPDDEDMRN